MNFFHNPGGQKIITNTLEVYHQEMNPISLHNFNNTSFSSPNLNHSQTLIANSTWPLLPGKKLTARTWIPNGDDQGLLYLKTLP